MTALAVSGWLSLAAAFLTGAHALLTRTPARKDGKR